MPALTYFAADGSYGGANDLVIVDTSSWSQDEWDIVDETPDSARANVAWQLAHGSIDTEDQPELPGLAE